MNKFKRVGFKSLPFEVEYTEEFMENVDTRIKNFNENFYNCEDLEEYTDLLVKFAMRQNYGSNQRDRMIEGFGKVWVKDFSDELYKPTDSGWKPAKEGELPNCGIILKIDTYGKKVFATTQEKIEDDYFYEIPFGKFK